MLTPEERHAKDIADGIRCDIRALTNALNEHTQILKTAETNRQTRHQRHIERKEPTVPDQERDERGQPNQNAQGDKHRWNGFEIGTLAIQGFLLLATVIAAGAAIWYADTAYQQKITMDGQWSSMFGQWMTMKQTLLEMQQQTPGVLSSAKAAQLAVTSNINAMRLDERAWIGMVGSSTVGGIQTGDNFSFQKVGITLRNTGKTPAIKMNASWITVPRDWRDPVPDYETEFKAIIKSRDAAREKEKAALEPFFSRFPEMAKSPIFRDIFKSADLFPPNHVLAPSAKMEPDIPAGSYPMHSGPSGFTMAIYIMGKISYSDIFQGTMRHTTRFCVMHVAGDRFVPCPSGDYMD